MKCHASLQRSDICHLKDYEKRTNNKISKNKNSAAKNQYLISKAPSNNVKMQLDKTLRTKNYFFLTTQQMGVFPNKTS